CLILNHDAAEFDFHSPTLSASSMGCLLEKCSSSKIPDISDRQPGIKPAGSCCCGADAGWCFRWNSDGDMPTRREKRALKLPRLEKPTAIQTSVTDNPLTISRCFALSTCARERYWCGVSPNMALNNRMKWKRVSPERRATALTGRARSSQFRN